MNINRYKRILFECFLDVRRTTMLKSESFIWKGKNKVKVIHQSHPPIKIIDRYPLKQLPTISSRILELLVRFMQILIFPSKFEQKNILLSEASAYERTQCNLGWKMRLFYLQVRFLHCWLTVGRSHWVISKMQNKTVQGVFSESIA